MGLKDGFSKFAKGVEGGAKTVVRKPASAAEISKLNKEMNSIEDNINKIYFEIGSLIFTKFQKGEEVGEEMEAPCRRIIEYKQNIEELRERIANLKNLKICPNCRIEMDINTKFCPECGVKQPIKEREEPAELKCPGCGVKIENGIKFCPNCGAKIE